MQNTQTPDDRPDLLPWDDAFDLAADATTPGAEAVVDDASTDETYATVDCVDDDENEWRLYPAEGRAIDPNAPAGAPTGWVWVALDRFV